MRVKKTNPIHFPLAHRGGNVSGTLIDAHPCIEIIQHSLQLRKLRTPINRSGKAINSTAVINLFYLIIQPPRGGRMSGVV